MVKHPFTIIGLPVIQRVLRFYEINKPAEYPGQNDELITLLLFVGGHGSDFIFISLGVMLGRDSRESVVGLL